MFSLKHLKLSILFTLSISLAGNVFADIYKHVDKKSGVTFSDIPPRSSAKLLAKTNEKAATQSKKPVSASYSDIKLLSPLHKSTVENAEANVLVNISLEPTLQESHKVQVVLDGTPQTTTKSTRFNLSGIPEGEHSILVQVIDAEKSTLIKSPTHKFTLSRENMKN